MPDWQGLAGHHPSHSEVSVCILEWRDSLKSRWEIMTKGTGRYCRLPSWKGRRWHFSLLPRVSRNPRRTVGSRIKTDTHCTRVRGLEHLLGACAHGYLLSQAPPLNSPQGLAFQVLIYALWWALLANYLGVIIHLCIPIFKNALFFFRLISLYFSYAFWVQCQGYKSTCVQLFPKRDREDALGGEVSW